MKYLSTHHVHKLTRLIAVAFFAVSVSFINGFPLREAQQAILMTGIMAMFGLYLGNIWLSIFLWWSLYLFGLSKFTMGQLYISNIFLGCVFYVVCKHAFKREYINWFINCFLGFVAVNIAYSALQVIGWDFLYAMNLNQGFCDNNNPTGFFAYRGAYGMLIALAIPLVMTRTWKLAIPISLAMFFPLYHSSSSVAIAAGLIGFLFCLYHKRYVFGKFTRYKNTIILVLAIVAILGGGLYAFKADNPQSSFSVRTDMWKVVLRDSIIHPVVGWGLDSYRNVSAKKPYVYALNLDMDKKSVDQFDNPHNLLISLVFEWGWLILIPLLFWVRDLVRRFNRAEKMPNVIGLGAFLIVLSIVSIGQFPMFLARFVAFIIPFYACFEIETQED